MSAVLQLRGTQIAGGVTAVASGRLNSVYYSITNSNTNLQVDTYIITYFLKTHTHTHTHTKHTYLN